ncbi:MAG: DEAD/DEAH box helicase [Candidatus Sumerlaeia bacterium]|nr:DEAD/DEAH box helicase [Candidatus Sumerlaeia bacterium]
MERFADLAALGLPVPVLDRLAACVGPTLLPLQQQALEQTGLVSRHESLLVAAPTASGKTLLAELAALACLNRLGLVLYLVPTRALAEEKAAEFAARYGPLGIRVACSTRDRRADDAAILSGAVHLTVAVYEKALALLGTRPGLLARFGLLVADEVQLLGDGERGGAVDLFLTRWRRASRRPQLLALSAVLGNAEELAEWLGVGLLRAESRPVPLREGVLDLTTGRFRWRETRTGERGEEALLDEPATGGEEGSLAAVADLARRLGPTILFCATRREALRAAFALAESAPFPPAEVALEALRSLEHDLSRERLEAVLTAGVGLHTADIPGSQRAVVERAFTDGELGVLVATPTLEQGVNLCAAAVVQTPLMVASWRGGLESALVPLSRARFVNQGGRAGRRGEALGRTMVFAEGPLAVERCWRAFVAAPLEPVQSPLGTTSLVGAVAGLLTAREAESAEELRAVLTATLGARRLDAATLEQRLSHDLADGERAGLWRAEPGGRLALTGLGEVLARTAVEPATLAQWGPLLEGLEIAACRTARVFLVMLAEEWDRFPLGVEGAERRRNHWPTGLRQRLSATDPLAARLRVRLQEAGGLPFACHRAARRALVLDDWLAGEPLAELELTHGLPSGQMARLASEAAWLATAAAELAGAVGAGADVVEGFEQLAGELATLTRPLEAPRSRPPAPMPAPAPLEATLAPDSPEPAPPLAGVTLCFPADDPGVVRFRGEAIPLPPIPYDLLRLLAAQAGRVVSYERIHAAIWPDAQVEQQMIPYHRGRIEKSLGVGIGDLIETRFKRGLRLRLDPSEVDLGEPPRLADSG